MNNSGVHLMSYAKTAEPDSFDKGRSLTHTYNNLAYEHAADDKNGKVANPAHLQGDNTHSTIPETDEEIVTNANVNPVHDKSNNTEVTSAGATPATHASVANSLPPEVPSPATKRKDSTVGFRLPAEHGSRRPSAVTIKSTLSDHPYRGMGKEDLLRHSSKPFWRRLRFVCISVVLIGWLALVIAVVALVLVYPRCRDPLEIDWWKKAVIYRIYVRSFQDHDGDGVGDLPGIRARLDYIKNLGVTTINLSPIYLSTSGSDSDADIVNHTAIDPVYGSMYDFVRLVNESHLRGLKVVMDFIPNQTSKQHQWFIQSSSSNKTNFKLDPKKNYYVWVQGQGVNYMDPPNNWRTVYNTSAWSFSTDLNKFYLHLFRDSQPELNLRSSEVKDELVDILQFWINKGVDGFYVRDSAFLFEDYDLRDEALLSQTSDQSLYSSYNHTFTYGRNEIFDMFARWHSFLDRYGKTLNKTLLLFADREGTPEQVRTYYGMYGRDGVDFPLNIGCLNLSRSTTGKQVASFVNQWAQDLPYKWPNWMSSTGFTDRAIDRMGEKIYRLFLTLIMLLPGTPLVYYGDEIGMKGLTNQTEQDYGQQNLTSRGPMQWDNTTNAGFCECTKGEPWMNVNPEYTRINVQALSNSQDITVFQLFTNLTWLRANNVAFQYGDYNRAVEDDDVFSFVRDYDGVKGYLVALNFARNDVIRNFYGTYATIPTVASVVMVTSPDVSLVKGASVSTKDLKLGAHQGVVLSWEFVAKEL